MSSFSLTAADVCKLKEAESQMKVTSNPLQEWDEEHSADGKPEAARPTAVF
jgi:hypothetical protein